MPQNPQLLGSTRVSVHWPEQRFQPVGQGARQSVPAALQPSLQVVVLEVQAPAWQARVTFWFVWQVVAPHDVPLAALPQAPA
jgi:hypothetical protein